jgi:hypothetical protein
MPIVYGDFTGLDYHYGQEEVDKKMIDIQVGMEELSKQGQIVVTEEELEFSDTGCSCCNTRLAGKRFEIELIHQTRRETK